MSKFFKRNYVDVMQIITPSYYKGLDEEATPEKDIDLVSTILKSEIDLIKQNIYIQPLSSSPLAGLLGYDAVEKYCSGLGKYLVKQNKLTEITPSELIF